MVETQLICNMLAGVVVGVSTFEAAVGLVSIDRVYWLQHYQCAGGV